MMKMALFPSLLTFLFLVVGSDGQSPTGQDCASHAFSGGKAFKACIDLPVLSSYLHWTYNAAAATVDLAYRRAGVAAPGRWVSWAINPFSSGMVGTQCLVAAVAPDGTVTAYTSPVTSYSTGLTKGRLSFNVSRLTALYADVEVTIFATLEVTGNKTKVNHVWQDGPLSANGVALSHLTFGSNMRSTGTMDFLAGADQLLQDGKQESPPPPPHNNNKNSAVKMLGVSFFPFCATLICTVISSLTSGMSSSGIV